ncbi:phospholipid-transporting ATPase VB-like isoform X2 [Argiope bruennichi]|uniref:Phospholipid-transporting ATPase n=2 Tax=Argiope bruennichi TaxID=94029 RepID=A0A8T0FXP7_ARGBR|nr:phospholipid-transporting ATPase VB-like isoform X2 [Argiope bruennichi]XP_055924259.1 phospholipid-transporting ATPase VB-like isoform X2 [Argiope bruennichi]KAF8795476.1 putative phospholipid-transporting ATPase VA like protein [Argiope bruennichi]
MPEDRSQSLADSDVAVHRPFSLVQRLFFWKNRKRPPEKQVRVVHNNVTLPENVPAKHHPHRGYACNRIRTTKYTVLSFIPKNLFEQFHRIANLYFIGIVLLNWVPKINAFGKEIAIIPVMFVLGVTAIKDWFEDFRRYKSDKRINNLTCRVYNRKERRYVKTLWKHVHVGDVVHLSCNEVIPADILLLKCSDDQGLCYIETASLDGESNLKQRQVVRGLMPQGEFHPSTFRGRIECDPPNHKIYHFNGCITMSSGQKVPICKENLLLKDCVLKNADFIEGIVVYAGHETKAMLNNDGPRYKRSKLEKLMNRDVIFCIVMLILLCLLGALGNGLWLSSFDNRVIVPFLAGFYTEESAEVYKEAFLIFWTFVIVLQVMIPLSLYVTIEIIKLGQVYFIHEDNNFYDKSTDRRIECRALNITEELGQVEYVFSDKTGTLTENNMVFRRCTIGGVDYDHERRMSGTSNGDESTYDAAKPLEDSNAKGDLILNSSLQEELSKIEIQLYVDSAATEGTHLTSDCQRIQDFFLLLAVCNTVVVAKHPHKDQMNSSGLFLNLTPTPHRLRGTSDGWDAPHEKYSHLLSEVSTPASSTTSTPVKRPRNLTLPLHLGCFQTPTPSPLQLNPIYEAESPDEIALVDTAFSYNCRLLRRTPDSVVLSLPGEGLIEFRILHVLPFDATRKRMSVILQHPITYEKILFCKGADSSIFPVLKPVTAQANKNMILKTQQHLNSYSRNGLRILCMAKKVISDEEYAKWLPIQVAAELSIHDKEQNLFQSACIIEQNLELLGATGIEDKLQDGVPETIHSLRAAGITVWVLTGDKQETAVNIAYSCKLFSTDMEIITLNARSKEAAEDTLKFYLDQIQKDIVTETCSSAPSMFSISSRNPLKNFFFGFNKKLTIGVESDKRQRALVIDGRTLAYVLDKPLAELFLNLAQHCTSVLCCRATPLQKAYIVSLVKETLGVTTLAIGDGANDVSMIQTGDVGIGISGKEGMQAVMASDFTMTRFKHLERLLLVHGHWCYDRLARTILYFFYKNATFIFIICWYQWYCGFSATVMIDQIYLALYNVLFTSLPPIALGILDKDCPDHLLLKYPSLYSLGRKAQVHTKFSFWVNMLDAIYQSIITFFIPFMAYYDSDVDIWEFGTTICTACVLGQLLHLAIETKSWTLLHGVSLLVSFLLYFGFAVVYNCWPYISAGREGLQNPYWVIVHAMSTAVFWFSILLAPVMSCLPRFILRSLQGSMFPSDVSVALRTYKQSETSSEASTVSVTWSRYSSNESSVDIGIHPEIKASDLVVKNCSFESNQTPENCAINS